MLTERNNGSARDVRARESILNKGILDDTDKLKESVAIIAIAKRAKDGVLLKSSPTVARFLQHYSVRDLSLLPLFVVAILRPSTGAVILTPQTIKGVRRPSQTDENTIPRGCHDDRNLTQIESNKRPETSLLTRTFIKTRNRGCRLWANC